MRLVPSADSDAGMCSAAAPAEELGTVISTAWEEDRRNRADQFLSASIFVIGRKDKTSMGEEEPNSKLKY